MGWLMTFVAGGLIYAGYVNQWALMAAAGSLLLAIASYLLGRSMERQENIPWLDSLCTKLEEHARAGADSELTDTVKQLRLHLRTWR